MRKVNGSSFQKLTKKKITQMTTQALTSNPWGCRSEQTARDLAKRAGCEHPPRLLQGKPLQVGAERAAREFWGQRALEPHNALAMSVLILQVVWKMRGWLKRGSQREQTGRGLWGPGGTPEWHGALGQACSVSVNGVAGTRHLDTKPAGIASRKTKRIHNGTHEKHRT